MKIIKDNIYGFIQIEPIIQKIIDTYEFQRLRFIKQLGFTSFVFPGAQHTRFEHSLGVYHLTKIFLETIGKNTKIDEKLQRIISISGLIHDLGHVSFSHMFDHHIIPKIKNGVEHELRSIQLFTKMNKKYNLGFTDIDLKLIGNIILGKVDKDYPLFVFQIIANKKNELDLDKIDYLMRDGYYLDKKATFDYKYLFNNTKIINGEIAYDVKTSFTILSLFNMRYELHKKFYNHKTVILYEVMVKDAIMAVFDRFDFEEIFSTDKWLYQLTDNFLFKLLEYPESKDIIEKIFTRKLYKIAPKNYDGEMIKISKHIGLTSHKQNPILKINFFDKDDNMFNLDMTEISIFNLLHSYEIKEFNIIRT